jgi:hypothetical protein
MKARIIFHGVAILVLLATVAAAQTPGKPASTAPTGQSADRQSSSPSVSEVTMDNEQARGREAASAMATGRSPHLPLSSAADKSLGSAHAPETLIAFTQADKARGGQTQVLVYKDSEDITSRYRPRNNRNSKSKPTTGSTTIPPGQ